MRDDAPARSVRPASETRVEIRPCRYCGRNVMWVPSAATGKLVPLDAGEAKGGVAFQVGRDLTGRLTATQVQLPEETHINHWITCPHAARARADQQRKRGGRR